MRKTWIVFSLLVIALGGAFALVSAQDTHRPPALLAPQSGRPLTSVEPTVDGTLSQQLQQTQDSVVRDYESQRPNELRQQAGPPAGHLRLGAPGQGIADGQTTLTGYVSSDGDQTPPVPSILSGRPPTSNATGTPTGTPPAGAPPTDSGSPPDDSGAAPRVIPVRQTLTDRAGSDNGLNPVPVTGPPGSSSAADALASDATSSDSTETANTQQTPPPFAPRELVVENDLVPEVAQRPEPRGLPTQVAPGLVLDSTGPQLQVSARGPAVVKVGKPANYLVTVDNSSAIAARDVSVDIRLPAWVSLVDSVNAAGIVEQQSDTDGRTISWNLTEIPSRATHELQLQLIVNENRTFDWEMEWRMKPTGSSTTVQVTQPALEMQIAGPNDVLFGETAVYQITVSNPGNGDAENVVIALPENLGGQNAALGTIPAGQQESFDIELTAQEAGGMEISAVVTADGNLRRSVSHAVHVRRAKLELEIQSPQFKYAGTVAEYRVIVQNVGDAPAEALIAAAALPEGCEFLGGIQDAEQIQGGVRWSVGTLIPGARLQYQIQCELRQAGTAHFEAGMRDVTGLSVASAADTVVEAVADLTIEVRDPQGPNPVGEEVVYEVTIHNRGTKAATNVTLLAQFSHGIEPIAGEGSAAEIADGQVAFAPIPALAPGQRATLRVKAVAGEAGNHIFRAHLQCNDPETHRIVEGTSRFFESTMSTASRPAGPQSDPANAATEGTESLRLPR